MAQVATLAQDERDAPALARLQPHRYLQGSAGIEPGPELTRERAPGQAGGGDQ